MNKISKKIVALATMAAFVLTLVPAAAFGAEYGSTVSVDEKYDQVTLSNTTDGADINVTVDLVAEDAAKADASTDGVYIWLTKDGIPYTSYAKYTGDAVSTVSGKDGNMNGLGKIAVTGSEADTLKATINVKNTGTYTVHAAIANSSNPQNISDLTEMAVGSLATSEVVAAEVEINSISVTSPTPDPGYEEAGTIAYLDGATPNSIDAQTVVATVSGVLAEDGETDAIVDGQTVAIENDNASRGLYVFEKGTEKEITEVPVEDGKIEFDVKAMSGIKAGTYHVYLAAGSAEYDLSVVIGTSTVDSIEVVDTDSSVVATTNPDFAGVVEFEFKDAAGNTVKAPALKYQVTGPEDHGLTASDLSVKPVEGKNTYKLAIDKATIKAGKYTVRVAIPNGKSVEVSFTAAKVGDTVSIEIAMDNNVETIVSGETVSGTVYAIDENGIKTPAEQKDVKLGFVNSAAVNTSEGSKTDVNLGTDGRFTVQAKDAEKYYGSKITLFAFCEDAKAQATKELTVVDGMTTNTLAFDNEAGSVAKDNTVKVSVVDENGKKVNVSGKAFVYVESTSNEDAKVNAVFANNNVTNGEVDLTVYASAETTADIVVAVKDANSKAIYANTLKYSFGEQDIPADTTVVMTIGSTDFVVNNEVITKEDAAPYIANDRTYVPFRALGEALGAEVNWDNDARTVTYTLGKTEVVLTIDETTYTVNGEEKTMDVAPVITGDRTYVPVRFVGEALGFSVTALYDTNGATASVVFQK